MTSRPRVVRQEHGLQAKNYTGSVGNAAVLQAISAKTFYGGDEAMVVTNSYCTLTITTSSCVQHAARLPFSAPG